MFKRDQILKGWNLDLDKDSRNYKENKALLQEFEKEFLRKQDKQQKSFSFSLIHHFFNPGPSCPSFTYH